MMSRFVLVNCFVTMKICLMMNVCPDKAILFRLAIKFTANNYSALLKLNIFLLLFVSAHSLD